jgi:hypothetical protein
MVGKRFGRRRRVVTWDENRLELLTGLCTVVGGMITVTSEYGTKSAQLDAIPPFDLARMMLRELAPDRDIER